MRSALIKQSQQISTERRGLSVVELILSVGLILILLSALFWAVNPPERLKQSRDTRRQSDFEGLKTAIEEALLGGEPLESTFGVPSSSVGFEVTWELDGSGWVPMVLPDWLVELPQDPSNGKTFSDVLGSRVLGEYQFISDGKYWVLRTHLEAETNRAKYYEDGNDNSWWEVGTAPGLSTYFGL